MTTSSAYKSKPAYKRKADTYNKKGSLVYYPTDYYARQGYKIPDESDETKPQVDGLGKPVKTRFNEQNQDYQDLVV